MNMSIKKIIAREGLILLGIILLGFCSMYLGDAILANGMVGSTGVIILFYGYPIYLLIRFIIWEIEIGTVFP